MNHYLEFIEYLDSVRNLCERTIKHYEGAIKTVSNELFSLGLIETSIFMIEDVEMIERLKDIYWSVPHLKEKDERGNRRTFMKNACLEMTQLNTTILASGCFMGSVYPQKSSDLHKIFG
ncbi:MAG: hypothetical protein HF977_16865 [ANME-2 cluster archaeon]|nr:hypothetical protein [ANME-2 cluster archaeon]